jgi:hypothetical protein
MHFRKIPANVADAPALARKYGSVHTTTLETALTNQGADSSAIGIGTRTSAANIVLS